VFEQIEQLYRDIASVDLLIARIADVLRVSQPHVSGQLDIRWWKLNGRDLVRHPVLVRWVKATTGRVQPKRVERYRGVGKHQAFDLNRKETDLAVKMFLKYAEQRATLRGKIRQLRQRLTQMSRLASRIRNDREHMDAIYYRIGKRLIAKGYLLDPATAKKMGLTPDAEV